MLDELPKMESVEDIQIHNVNLVKNLVKINDPEICVASFGGSELIFKDHLKIILIKWKRTSRFSRYFPRLGWVMESIE